jgi:hypothetical protein
MLSTGAAFAADGPQFEAEDGVTQSAGNSPPPQLMAAN